ncbi:AAA family ATPase [Streptomyces litmocidini]|uniref:ATP-binding protein n=1 Tax=Streptomyces litmocidini TaxID=67318 RepID=UPI0033D01372
MSDALGHDGPAPSGGAFEFVGRRSELGLLLAAVRHPPAVVMVEGEGGIGKTRLLHEAGTVLAAEGRPVLTGVCHPLREPSPYGPVVDALRKAGPLLPAAEDLPPTAGALAPLLLDLADRLPPPPAPPDGPAARRHQTVQAVRSLLGALGPAVLIVDDLHWADDDTRELLLLLARDLPGQLSMVLAYRPEDLPGRMPVLGAAYRRPPGVSGTSIRLTPLSREDVQELATSAMGAHATAEIGGVLYDRSQGLPLVAEEDLLTLREQNTDPADRDLAGRLERADVPTGLREAVVERLNGLPKPGIAITSAAAVLAVPASEDLLARVTGMDTEQASEGLTAALRASLLQELAPGRYVFRHTLAQQVAYRHTPAPRRRHLHERAIAELRNQSPPPMVQIAHHTLAVGDREAWLRRAQEAADQATALGDTGTAAALLHQLLDQPHLADDVRSRAALALARIAYDRADHTTSAALLRRILGDPQLPTATRGEIRLGLALLLINHASDRAGFRDLAQAVDELADRPEQASRAMVALAVNERDGAARQSWAWIERAERTLRGSTDEAAHAAVRATRLTLLARDGSPELWQELERLPRRADDIEVLRQTVRGLFNAGACAFDNGDDHRARGLLTECRQLAEHLGLPLFVCYSRFSLVQLEWAAGRWSGMEEALDALGAEYPDLALSGFVQDRILGQLATVRGHFSKAIDHLKSAAADADDQPQVNDSLRIAAALATVRLAQDAPEDAFALAKAAVGTLRETDIWTRGVGLVAVAAQAALATGRREFAEQLADDVESGLVGREAPGARAELDIARGMLLQDTDASAAAEHFARAHRAWQEIGRPYETAEAAEHRGCALASAQPEASARDLAEAADTFRQLGATADATRCLRTLNGLGLERPAARGRRGYGGRLSPREREVAELLARGATNQDIAQSLFLSPRTVEKHVAHVLKKLDTTRRNVPTALRDADHSSDH